MTISPRMGGTSTPARRRLLETATRLFYANGIHAVGIDRIIAEADVAKATFYNNFPSKDDLVRSYVEEQDRLGQEAVVRLVASGPRARLLAVLQRIGTAAQQSDFRGCPFLNAAAEYPDPASPVRQAIERHRTWYRGMLLELLGQLGHPDADRTADLLVIVSDGLLVGAELDQLEAFEALIADAVDRIVGTGLDGL